MKMKKVCSTALIIFLSVLLTIPAFAVDVGKSTPVIDGEKDAAYDKSYSFNIFDQENVDKGNGWYSTFGDTATSMDATIYYLWDNSFLYAFIEVQTEKLTDAGESYIKDSDNPWESEAIELWFLWTDLDDSAERVKISVDPLYNKSWGDGPYYDEVSAGSNAVAKVTDKGYNAEFAVKIPANYLKQGGQIKATLQINDRFADGTVAVGQQIASGGTNDVGVAPILTLGAEIVIAPPPAPEPAPTEAPQPEPVAVVENVPAAPIAAAAPQTSDGASVILLMLALSGASLAAAFKKRTHSAK